MLVIRDVTVRQRFEEELERASRLESIGILAGGIAHDFNNILTAIMGNITLALLDASGLVTVERYLKEAERATLRARDLTQQLLTFAKGGEPVRAAVLLPEIIREVTEFALHGSQVKCEFDLPSGLWPADADRGQLGQVVQNLVINAVQAMPEGGSIRISAANETVGPEHEPAVLPGRLCAHLGGGHGHGHQAGAPREDLRSVLHHQAAWQRAGPDDGLFHHPQAPAGTSRWSRSSAAAPPSISGCRPCATRNRRWRKPGAGTWPR